MKNLLLACIVLASTSAFAAFHKQTFIKSYLVTPASDISKDDLMSEVRYLSNMVGNENCAASSEIVFGAPTLDSFKVNVYLSLYDSAENLPLADALKQCAPAIQALVNDFKNAVPGVKFAGDRVKSIVKLDNPNDATAGGYLAPDPVDMSNVPVVK